MDFNVDRYGNVRCNCGRILSPDLTDLSQSCIFCYCCVDLGNHIVYQEGEGYRFYHNEFVRVVKWRYEDDGDGYVDKMEGDYKQFTSCPFCGQDLESFINRRLASYDSWKTAYIQKIKNKKGV